jgi:hypothetical protein
VLRSRRQHDLVGVASQPSRQQQVVGDRSPKPNESRSARFWAHQSLVRGCAKESNDRHRCADIRKGVCSRKRWLRRIVFNIPVSEVGIRYLLVAGGRNQMLWYLAQVSV